MNREEKREIRLEINKLLDSHCKGCEHQYSKGETPSYCTTICPVGISFQGLSGRLIADERSRAKKELQVDEEPTKEGPWSQEEEFYLLNHLNLHQVKHLSNRLNRAPKSVSAKASYLRRKFPDLVRHKRCAR